MNYDEMVSDFTESWYEELFRRLRSEGYDVKVIKNNDTYANIYLENALICQIKNKNELIGDWCGKAVKKIAEETAEYVFMYKTSPPIHCSSSSKQLIGYRKLLSYNDQILAVRKVQEKGYHFATGYRRLLSSNQFILDKEFKDYSKACEDFAKRSGLIDAEKLFNESEIKVIRSGLNQLVKISPPEVTFEELKAIGHVLNKISFILVSEKQLPEPCRMEVEVLEL